MRRNIIKVTDEIKEGGRNEDTEDFSLLSSLESKALGSNETEMEGKKLKPLPF